MLAFGLFILLSVYHFGQSNWVSVRYREAWLARLHYLLWGAGVLLTPILLHAGEAINIVGAMTGVLLPAPGAGLVTAFISGMAVLNVAVVVGLFVRRMIDKKRVVLEVVAYALLMTLFFTNSLLLGFTVYFVFWHSLASAQDQIRFFDRHLSPALRRKLLVHIGCTVVGALVFCLVIWFGPGPAAALQPAVIGGVFIAISLLTLPHMLLVERLYAVWSPAGHVPTPDTAGAGTNIAIHTSRSTAGRTIGEGLPITY